MIIRYTANAEQVADTISNLPDDTLRAFCEVADILPDLFPQMTKILADTELRGRDR